MFSLKILGVVLIITGFGIFGLLGAGTFTKRLQQLRSIRMAMEFLEKEITYLHTPLSLALERAAQSTAQPARMLFSCCAQNLQQKQGLTITEAWDMSLKKLGPVSDLKNEDLELLAAVSSQIGMSGAEDQRKFFKLIEEQLKIQEEKARQELQSGHKIRAYGGFILGITVVLLLI